MHCAIGAPPLVVDENAAGPCAHVDGLPVDTVPGSDGCLTCLAEGSEWVSLRMCQSCGHVGCCDASKNKHATDPFHTTRHPIVRSFEPGETWAYCYEEGVLL